MIKIEVLDEIKNVVASLNKIENRGAEASEELSKTELAINDLYHFIEFTNLDTKGRYRIVGELRDKLICRRKLKQELDLINEFNNQKNKLLLKENRPFLINSLNQKLKCISQPYKNRVYSSEELFDLVK